MRMTDTSAAILVMAAIVLLPIVPAYLLFRFLPSSGDAESPWHGLQIRFGGAFAGYLVVLAALIAIRPKDTVHYHTWTVVGSVAFDHQQDEPDPNINDVLVRAVPPRLAVMNEGRFAWEIPVAEDDSGNAQFPDLQVDLRGYAGLTVPLGQESYGAAPVAETVNAATRTITLKQPLRMASTRSTTKYAGAIP